MATSREEREQRLREYEERYRCRLAGHPSDRLPVQSRGGMAERGWERLMLHGIDGKGTSIARDVAEAAWEGYDADGHGGQSSERLHQRGGFGLGELGYYLARAFDEGRIEIVFTKRSRRGGAA